MNKDIQAISAERIEIKAYNNDAELLPDDSLILLKSISQINIIGAKTFEMSNHHKKRVEKFANDEFLFMLDANTTYNQQIKLTNSSRNDKEFFVTGNSVHLVVSSLPLRNLPESIKKTQVQLELLQHYPTEALEEVFDEIKHLKITKLYFNISSISFNDNLKKECEKIMEILNNMKPLKEMTVYFINNAKKYTFRGQNSDIAESFKNALYGCHEPTIQDKISIITAK